jgi:hypothetical protein
VDSAELVLLTEQDSAWGQGVAVKEVITRLIQEKAQVLGFTDPDGALLYLSGGGCPPDVIVFDLKYLNKSQEAVRKSLATLLASYYVTVQVYTNEPQAQAESELRELREKFPMRLAAPVSKGAVDAVHLAGILDERLKGSLSAHLGSPVRKTALKAIESALVRIGDLPLDRVFGVLTGAERNHEDDETAEQSLLELLYVKLGEALRSDRGLQTAVATACASKGIDDCADDIVATIVSQIRRQFLSEGWLRNTLKSVIDLLRSATRANQAAPREPEDSAAREFFAFRVYDLLPNDMVQCGDILHFSISGQEQDAMVITPPCDLDKFWKKTRGVLTLIRMRSFEDGYNLAQVGGNKFEIGNSITAKEPYILPPIPPSNMADCCIFPGEIFSWCLTKPDAAPSKASLPVEQLEALSTRFGVAGLKRLARVSEPFLSGILDSIHHAVFRMGLPDRPKEEYKRIDALKSVQAAAKTTTTTTPPAPGTVEHKSPASE